MTTQNAMRMVFCAALLVLVHQSSAQTPYDAEARTALANEINQTYGNLVSPSLSIAELFDIKNRLDKADSIAQKYGVDLDYRQHCPGRGRAVGPAQVGAGGHPRSATDKPLERGDRRADAEVVLDDPVR
jgi:hypothetical protein